MQENPELKRETYIEWASLVIGFMVGVALAWWLNGIGLSAQGEVAQARSQGIVSLTTLNDYPKSQDTFNFLLSLLLPVLAAGITWRLAPVRRGMGSGMLEGGFRALAIRPWTFLAVLLLVAIASWHHNTIHERYWNLGVGAWGFLGEQGCTLSWIQALESGQVYGRDFFCLYGPMLIYPLYWLMKVLGVHTSMIERYYQFFLQLLSYGLILYLLLRTLRSRTLAWIMGVFIIALYPAMMRLSMNTTLLRTALPLFALGCLAMGMDSEKRSVPWKFMGAILLGQSLLFSQESGLAATAAAIAMIVLEGTARTGSIRKTLVDISRLGLTMLLSMAPMMVYLLWKGAGAAMLDSLVGYPRLVMSGYGAKPFPSLRDLFSPSFRQCVIHYSALSIYAGSLIALGLAWLKKVRSVRFIWALGLTLFGILLFRKALGRSEPAQTIGVMLPALFLAGIWIDEVLESFRRDGIPAPSRVVTGLTGALSLLVFIGGIGWDPTVRNALNFSWTCATSLSGKFERLQGKVAVPVHPRLGHSLDRQTRGEVEEIGEFLRVNATPSEPVYFFPNEAAYYFLFERVSPTRYAISYLAGSFDRQREVIRDLEIHQPRYVVYSLRTWRVDGIPEAVQVPLIVEYLRAHYRRASITDSVEFLVRK